MSPNNDPSDETRQFSLSFCYAQSVQFQVVLAGASMGYQGGPTAPAVQAYYLVPASQIGSVAGSVENLGAFTQGSARGSAITPGTPGVEMLIFDADITVAGAAVSVLSGKFSGGGINLDVGTLHVDAEGATLLGDVFVDSWIASTSDYQVTVGTDGQNAARMKLTISGTLRSMNS
jgi:hypothetical protein